MGEAEENNGRTGPFTIALVGFMAVGKSTVGRLLAARLSLPFVDTDALVELREGPIPAIFARRGEEAFRRIEREVALEALARDAAAVVALGGGAVLSDEVRSALSGLPYVVWLTAPVDVLWRRALAAGASGRPLACDEASFRALYEQRAGLYREVATSEVVCDGSRSEAAVAAEIAGLAPAAPRARVGGGGADSR